MKVFIASKRVYSVSAVVMWMQCVTESEVAVKKDDFRVRAFGMVFTLAVQTPESPSVRLCYIHATSYKMELYRCSLCQYTVVRGRFVIFKENAVSERAQPSA